MSRKVTIFREERLIMAVCLIEPKNYFYPSLTCHQRKLRNMRMLNFLCALNEQEEKIITLLYGLRGKDIYTLRKTERKFNLRRTKVRQLVTAALNKLRHLLQQRREPFL